MTIKRAFWLFSSLFLLISPSYVTAGIIDFDSLSPGSTVTTIDGVNFSSNTGLDLIVSDFFDAASGENYLGVDDGGFEAFLPSFGDIITLQFDDPINSLMVSFISTPFPPIGTYSISTAFGDVFSAELPDATLGDGGEFYIVTFTSASPFTSADLSGGDNGVHSFNIDTIVFNSIEIPEPGTLMLLGMSCMILLGRRMKSTRSKA